MKLNRKSISIISVIVIILLLILLKINLNFGNENNKNSSTKINKSLIVNAIVLKPSSLQDKIFTNGTLIGNEEVELRSETSGKITAILFEEGKKVNKGELLVKINNAELLALLKKNVIGEDLAKDKEFRAKQLLEKNLSSQQEYDVVLNELNLIKADIEYTRAQIAKTEIKAPFDGIIGLRSVSIGSYISPQTKVASLQSIDPIKIDFAVPQKYFNEVKKGKEIEFKLPNSAKTRKGRIYAIEPKIDQNTRTILVRAVAENKDKELTPGAYVEVDIILENLNDALLIPTEAIVPDIQGEKIFLFKNGLAIPRLVTIGIRTEEQIQLLSGVNIGDTVIVSGMIQLRPNSQVKLKSIN